MVRSNAFEAFFEISDDKSTASCKKCNKLFKGCVPGNLKRHIGTAHPDIRLEPNESLKSRTSGSVKNKITIKMNHLELKEACIEMLTRDSLPYRFMDSNGFRKIVDPIASALGVTINASNMKEEVKVAASKIKRIISQELKGKIFCLKIDSASRYVLNLFFYFRFRLIHIFIPK